jgi:hypothetical protein
MLKVFVSRSQHVISSRLIISRQWTRSYHTPSQTYEVTTHHLKRMKLPHTISNTFYWSRPFNFSGLIWRHISIYIYSRIYNKYIRYAHICLQKSLYEQVIVKSRVHWRLMMRRLEITCCDRLTKTLSIHLIYNVLKVRTDWA